MRSPHHIGPSDPAPAGTDDATVLTGTIAEEPVLFLLTRYRVAQRTEDGVLLCGDALDAALRARGAQPMTDIDFDREPAPGWRAVIDTRHGSVQLIAPGDELIHEGDLACEPSWSQQIAERQHEGRGLVVITGAAAPTAAAALEMIAAGLANWLRVPIELTL
ncbi:Uncharacterised protein [Nocardia otitidiscaviarum]|uniref:Uncharacterized protein n=1 Tax=Nocardia otitidiscaviarum TaxID=1823 RepID=A0A379JLJ2_9NOCA|nr:hypothetical protein [Nocardia otitidiscaviarum]SUD49519.1 Uncharacterised protein [Nocardia otitidiscaviarum]